MTRIALAQCRQTGDFAENVRAIWHWLEEASRAGAQIVCFPETQTVGYRVDISTPERPVPASELQDLHEEIAAWCGKRGIACILGTETPLAHDPAGGKPYNSALVISERGQMLGVHHKTKLTPLDAIAYSPGTSIETFELCGVKVGVVICFEGFRFPETTRECVRQGAQLVFHPQNNTTRPNDWKVPVHESMIVTRAAENTIWFASCNACLVPHQNCKSLVVAPDGLVAAASQLGREELVVADLDISRATRAMFRYDLTACAELLFADTVQREEFAAALPGVR